LARGEADGVPVRGEVEGVGVDAANAPLGQRVAVDGDEEVAAGDVGEAGTLLEAHELVGLAREDDLEALLGQDGAELLRDGPRDGLLARAVPGARSSGRVGARRG